MQITNTFYTRVLSLKCFRLLRQKRQNADYYRACPTVKEYVLVNTGEPLVELYRREKHPLWTYRTFEHDDELILTSVNLSLPIRAIYKNVIFDV